MNTYCCVPSCNSLKKLDPTLSFHKFPHNNELIKVETQSGAYQILSRRQVWFNNLQITNEVGAFMKVCSLHFKESDYFRFVQRKKLKRTAIPTQKLPPVIQGTSGSGTVYVASYESGDTHLEPPITNTHSLEETEVEVNLKQNQSDDDMEAANIKLSVRTDTKVQPANMDSITTATGNLKVTDNSKMVTSFINLDSDDDDNEDEQMEVPKAAPPPPEVVVKRIAKKSTVSINYKQPPAAATRRQVALANKQKVNTSYDRFMENFDPESSARERRKLTRKVNTAPLPRKVLGALYDENGIHISTGIDLCDCLQKMCTGCHFPCPKCGSPKCGMECRCNRKFMYDQVEYHGCDYVVKSPIPTK